MTDKSRIDRYLDRHQDAFEAGLESKKDKKPKYAVEVHFNDAKGKYVTETIEDNDAHKVLGELAKMVNEITNDEDATLKFIAFPDDD